MLNTKMRASDSGAIGLAFDRAEGGQALDQGFPASAWLRLFAKWTRCCGGHHRMFNNTPDLCPVEAGRTPHP